jgi:uncharacterized membrane protein YuzA (DUF378 family)
MRAFRWTAVALVIAGAIVIGLWWIEGGQAPFSNRIVYLLIGVAAAISIIALFINDTGTLDRTGRSSGDERGPEPGDGAVIHHSSGEADFDGLPGNVPPPIKAAERDLPYPHKKAAD